MRPAIDVTINILMWCVNTESKYEVESMNNKQNYVRSVIRIL